LLWYPPEPTSGKDPSEYFEWAEKEVRLRQQQGMEYLHFLGRFQHLAHIHLSGQVMTDIIEEGWGGYGTLNVVFKRTDITKIRSRVKHMPMVEESEGLAAFLGARATTNRALALRLLKRAANCYSTAISNFTDNSAALIAQ